MEADLAFENCVFLLTTKPPRTTLADLRRPGHRRRTVLFPRSCTFGSYTLSKANGLQPSSGHDARGRAESLLALRPPSRVTFGQDPNDLTNARGRLPIARTCSGLLCKSTRRIPASWSRPTAGEALINPTETTAVIETRGTERLSSQTLLDVRVSKAFRMPGDGWTCARTSSRRRHRGGGHQGRERAQPARGR